MQAGLPALLACHCRGGHDPHPARDLRGQERRRPAACEAVFARTCIRQEALGRNSGGRLEIGVSNQPSNNRPRQRHTPVDVSGPCIAAQEQDAKASAAGQHSLTRKRSLVQIQYGPRYFSKTCLAARAIMRASDLRFLPLTAGQSVRCCGRHEGFPGRFGAPSRRFRRARAQLASPISKVIAGPKGGAVRSWSRGSKEARSLPAVPHRHQLVSARHRPDPRLRTHARPDNERY